MKIGRGVSELWKVENLPLPLTWPMAYTIACTTVQAVIIQTYDAAAVINNFDCLCMVLDTISLQFRRSGLLSYRDFIDIRYAV